MIGFLKTIWRKIKLISSQLLLKSIKTSIVGTLSIYIRKQLPKRSHRSMVVQTRWSWFYKALGCMTWDSMNWYRVLSREWQYTNWSFQSHMLSLMWKNLSISMNTETIILNQRLQTLLMNLILIYNRGSVWHMKYQ